jgi:hypothetical protein
MAELDARQAPHRVPLNRGSPLDDRLGQDIPGSELTAAEVKHW